MGQRLDASAVRRWATHARAALEAHRQEIDDLNVYPVPDGDTGTNMLLTMQAVERAVADGAEPADGAESGVTDAMRTLTQAAVMGARGNSGVILSQLLRGAADGLAEAKEVGAPGVRTALRRAADAAYAAVAEPVEGTILTVARAAADAATAADTDDPVDVLRAAVVGASAALANTPKQLAALARAGVVDAGGRGYCVVLESLLAAVTGDAGELSAPAPAVVRDRSGIAAAREAGSPEFGYEVQYLLDAPDAVIPELKDALALLGDSLVVVGGDGLHNVHVHVNDVGAAIEAGITAGRPHRIAVTRFADQIADQIAEQILDGEAARPAPSLQVAGVLGTTTLPRQVARAVIAVAPGPGLADLFTGAGAVVVVGGPTMNPSTGELVGAIEATGATEIVLLPNDGNIHGGAAQASLAARERGLQVRVVPTRSPVQGLAALAVHDDQRDFGDDVIAMTAAAGATRWAEVTTAVREAQTSAGVCHAGDVLGLIEGDVAVIGKDLRGVAVDVVDRMLFAGGELVTVVCGADCPAHLADGLVEHLRDTHPLVEAEVHQGGQPHYPLLLGVE